MRFSVGKLESAKSAEQEEHRAGEPKEELEFGLKIPDRSRCVAIIIVDFMCPLYIIIYIWSNLEDRGPLCCWKG